jgi:hypothetical protein
VLDWNEILLQANADDHTFGSPEQGSPTRSSRAMAIVHAAIFDAVNSIEPTAKPYLVQKPGKGASIDAAVATAAHDTLVALYPRQADVFDEAYEDYLIDIPKSSSKNKGVKSIMLQKVLSAQGQRFRRPRPSRRSAHNVDRSIRQVSRAGMVFRLSEQHI